MQEWGAILIKISDILSEAIYYQLEVDFDKVEMYTEITTETTKKVTQGSIV